MSYFSQNCTLRYLGACSSRAVRFFSFCHDNLPIFKAKYFAFVVVLLFQLMKSSEDLVCELLVK